MMRSVSALLALLLAGTACKNAPPPPAHEVDAKRATPLEGEMCKLHGVLQAICTKCNPRLVPVFQAKGDWCAEHGLPESVCPICHPERGGKPVHAVTEEKAPRDGLRIRFKRADTARTAGIEWTLVAEQKNTSAVLAPARLSYDATRLAQVNARSPGVVRALKVDVGSIVKKGAPLAVIDSPSVGADRARLAAAKTRVTTAEENLTRQQMLVREGVATRQSLLVAEQELSSARGEQAALGASLSILGAGGGGIGGYTLTAPIAGVVTDRKVTIGKLVDGEEVLLEIVDTRSMWADVEVAESDLLRLAPGQQVILTFDGLADRELKGTITYVAPAVDPRTRTAKARVPLENPDGVLRANLFGQARIAASEARAALAVPRSAVQHAGGTSFVFVRLSDTEFETRRVTLGEGDAGTVEVRSGVKPGENVVTTGSFLLKTETSKENIGAGCCVTD
jgi:membrane fusion protein, heavy metal efflux system